MNASSNDITIRRWITGNPTGDGWTRAELAALAAAATTDPRIDAAEVAGATDAHFPADLDADDFDDDCIACSGTGLGMYDGAACSMCGGTGAAHVAPLWGDDEGDDWLDDFYVQVQRDELAERVA